MQLSKTIFPYSFIFIAKKEGTKSCGEKISWSAGAAAQGYQCWYDWLAANPASSVYIGGTDRKHWELLTEIRPQQPPSGRWLFEKDPAPCPAEGKLSDPSESSCPPRHRDPPLADPVAGFTAGSMEHKSSVPRPWSSYAWADAALLEARCWSAVLIRGVLLPMRGRYAAVCGARWALRGWFCQLVLFAPRVTVILSRTPIWKLR